MSDILNEIERYYRKLNQIQDTESQMYKTYEQIIQRLEEIAGIEPVPEANVCIACEG